MIFFTLILIAQCDTFLDPIFILSLRGQSGLLRSERMRFSLDYSDHTPLVPSFKKLGNHLDSRVVFFLIQEFYKWILIGIRDLVVYYLFLLLH